MDNNYFYISSTFLHFYTFDNNEMTGGLWDVDSVGLVMTREERGEDLVSLVRLAIIAGAVGGSLVVPPDRLW